MCFGGGKSVSTTNDNTYESKSVENYGSEKYLYEIMHDSYLRGDNSQSYITSNNKNETVSSMQKGFKMSKINHVIYIGSCDYNTSEYEMVSMFGLDSNQKFLS
jgi:hypothetical protein